MSNLVNLMQRQVPADLKVYIFATGSSAGVPNPASGGYVSFQFITHPLHLPIK